MADMRTHVECTSNSCIGTQQRRRPGQRRLSCSRVGLLTRARRQDTIATDPHAVHTIWHRLRIALIRWAMPGFDGPRPVGIPQPAARLLGGGNPRAHLGRILLELVESTSSEGVGADQRNLKKKHAWQLTASGVASSLVQARPNKIYTKAAMAMDGQLGCHGDFTFHPFFA